MGNSLDHYLVFDVGTVKSDGRVKSLLLTAVLKLYGTKDRLSSAVGTIGLQSVRGHHMTTPVTVEVGIVSNNSHVSGQQHYFSSDVNHIVEVSCRGGSLTEMVVFEGSGKRDHTSGGVIGADLGVVTSLSVEGGGCKENLVAGNPTDVSINCDGGSTDGGRGQETDHTGSGNDTVNVCYSQVSNQLVARINRITVRDSSVGILSVKRDLSFGGEGNLCSSDIKLSCPDEDVLASQVKVGCETGFLLEGKAAVDGDHLVDWGISLQVVDHVPSGFDDSVATLNRCQHAGDSPRCRVRPVSGGSFDLNCFDIIVAPVVDTAPCGHFDGLTVLHVLSIDDELEFLRVGWSQVLVKWIILLVISRLPCAFSSIFQLIESHVL